MIIITIDKEGYISVKGMPKDISLKIIDERPQKKTFKRWILGKIYSYLLRKNMKHKGNIDIHDIQYHSKGGWGEKNKSGCTFSYDNEGNKKIDKRD